MSNDNTSSLPVPNPFHTDEHPFCLDPTCRCHEDQEAIVEVTLYVDDGLLTPQEATAFLMGRII